MPAYSGEQQSTWCMVSSCGHGMKLVVAGSRKRVLLQIPDLATVP